MLAGVTLREYMSPRWALLQLGVLVSQACCMASDERITYTIWKPGKPNY